MIILHALIPLNTDDFPDVWRPTLPCNATYHDGYPHERMSPRGHAECMRISGWEPTSGYLTGLLSIFCECEDCSTHYFFGSDRNFDESIGQYLCNHCRDDIHQTIGPPA